MEILNSYIKSGLSVTEYTKDGTTVSHTVKKPIPSGVSTPEEPTELEQILYETQYQTMILEMGGGV